jgi:hypothetical protein
VPTFVEFNPTQLSRVVVLDVDKATRDSRPQQSFDGAAHCTPCLARADNVDMTDVIQAVTLLLCHKNIPSDMDVTQNGLFGIGRLKTGLEDLESLMSQKPFYHSLNL